MISHEYISVNNTLIVFDRFIKSSKINLIADIIEKHGVLIIYL